MENQSSGLTKTNLNPKEKPDPQTLKDNHKLDMETLTFKSLISRSGDAQIGWKLDGLKAQSLNFPSAIKLDPKGLNISRYAQFETWTLRH